MAAVALVAALVGVVATTTWWTCRGRPELRGLVPWLLTGLTAATILVGLLDRPFGSGTDELVYQRQATSVWMSLVLTGSIDGDTVVLDEGKWGWPTVLGIAYRAVGDDNPYFGIAINVVVAYVALLLAASAGCRVWGPRRWDWRMGAVFVLSPAVLVFSPSLLRETWVWLSVAIGVQGLISLVEGRRVRGSVVLAVAILLAYWIRLPMAAIVLGAAAFAVMIAWVWRRWGELAAVLCVGAAVIVGQRLLTIGVGYLGLTPEDLFATRDYLAVTSTTGFAPSDPFTPIGLARSMVRVGLGPLPWEFRPAPVWGWVFVNWAFWILVLVAAFAALRRSGLTAARVALLVFAGVILVGLAVSLTNYGIVVRMRAIVMIPVLPLLWGLLRPPVVAESQAAEKVAA